MFYRFRSLLCIITQEITSVQYILKIKYQSNMDRHKIRDHLMLQAYRSGLFFLLSIKRQLTSIKQKKLIL
jgi:hypothetical protein